MDEKIKLIINALNNKVLFPYELEIRPSAICNLKCRICNPRQQFLEGKNYTKKNEQIELVTKDRYSSIFKESVELGISNINICGGGEPFIRKDMIEIMKGIKEKGISGNIVTNGTLLNNEIIKELIEIKWDNIIFSVNGSNKLSDKFLRGDNAFIYSINNIKKILKMRQEKPKITLAPVVCKYNQNEIIDFIKLTKNLKIDDLLFQPITLPKNLQKKYYIIKTKEFKKYLKKCISISRSYSVKTNLNGLFSFYFNSLRKDYNKLPICFEPLYRMTIQPNGNAEPCPIVLKGPHNEIRSINIKYKSLKSIWNRNYFLKFRERLLNNIKPDKRFCEFCCGMIQLNTIKIKDKLLKCNKRIQYNG